MVKTIVKLVLSEASNFDLMYTVMEVAVEHSGIFTSLCRQGTEIFHDDVEIVLSDFVYYARTEGLFELKPQNGHQSIFSETGPVLQEAVQKGILTSKKDFFALAPSDKQVDC